MAARLNLCERPHLEAKHGLSKIIKLRIQVAENTARKEAKYVRWLNSDQKFFMDVNKLPVHYLFFSIFPELMPLKLSFLKIDNF